MIGVFGLLKADRSMPADLSAMAATVPSRYTINSSTGNGGAIGVVEHAEGFPAGRAGATDTNVAVTGAIFNVEDLAGNKPGIVNAAQLIEYLYNNDQLARLSEANGQFAAAIYDKRRHRLILITDRMGTTAVHVWQQGHEVVFSTQLYTLLGDRRIARKPNPAAIAQLFTMQRTIGDTSPIEGVTALPAACIATFDERGGNRQSYWKLTWDSRGFDRDEGALALAEAMRKAIVRQTIGKRNGLLLSGGVDSRMILAAAPQGRLTSWTTAGFEGNRELALARKVAAMFGSPHQALIVEPADTLAVNDDTVVESGGLYPASNPMSAFLPRVGQECDVILTGHALDYTLRGYYLPTRFIEIGSSRTRLPMLRTIPRRPSGRDVFTSLRQGPSRSTVERIVRPNYASEWWCGQEDQMDRILRPWLDSEEPYNAWDAFILHAVNKHYAFTGMMATRAVADLAMPAYDNEVMGIYLNMPPSERVTGRLVHKAMRHLSPEAAELRNANTHFRADLDPWLEVAALLFRAGMRRVGLAARPALPSLSHSDGSWQNVEALYRDEPGHRRRFKEIRARLDSLTCGILSTDGIAACIDEHLDGRVGHAKLMRQLLTHDAWVRRFGIEARA